MKKPRQRIDILKWLSAQDQEAWFTARQIHEGIEESQLVKKISEKLNYMREEMVPALVESRAVVAKAAGNGRSGGLNAKILVWRVTPEGRAAAENGIGTVEKKWDFTALAEAFPCGTKPHSPIKARPCLNMSAREEAVSLRFNDRVILPSGRPGTFIRFTGKMGKCVLRYADIPDDRNNRVVVHESLLRKGA